MPGSKMLFNQVDNRSIKEIRLSTVWKHVLNDNSKAVKTLLVRMAEVVNINSVPRKFLWRLNVTRMQIFQSRKNLTLFDNQTDIRLWDFEVKYVFSICKTAISYRKDFVFAKLSNDILNTLNFFFIVPAWIVFIFLCFPDVFPENWIHKNYVRNKLKVWKRGEKEFAMNY